MLRPADSAQNSQQQQGGSKRSSPEAARPAPTPQQQVQQPAAPAAATAPQPSTAPQVPAAPAAPASPVRSPSPVLEPASSLGRDSLLSSSISDLAAWLNQEGGIDLGRSSSTPRPAAAAAVEPDVEAQYEQAMAELEALLRDLRVPTPQLEPTPRSTQPKHSATKPPRSGGSDRLSSSGRVHFDEGEERRGSALPSCQGARQPPSFALLAAAEPTREAQIEFAPPMHPPNTAPQVLEVIHEGAEPSGRGDEDDEDAESVDLAVTDPWLLKPEYERARRMAEEIAERQR